MMERRCGTCLEHCRFLQTTLAERDRTIARLTEEKDDAYLQRNHVVAALARCFPSGVRKTNIEGWSADWHGCVYIDLPAGQISYHYHDSQAGLFHGLPAYEKPYDGHTKQQVHDRLSSANAMATIARLREALGQVPLPKHTASGEEFYSRFYTWHNRAERVVREMDKDKVIPYPEYCRHKDQCAGKSSCPEDPTCAD